MVDRHHPDPLPDQAADTPGRLTACPGCDLLFFIEPPGSGRYLACSRCGSMLARTVPDSINRVLALSSAGLLLYLPAVTLPLLTLSTLGFKERSNVIHTAVQLFANNYYFVSVMVLATAVVFPVLKLFLPFMVALGLKLGKRPPLYRHFLRQLKHLDEWGMIEVYLIGILITLIKTGDLAQIEYNLGFFCFFGLVLLSMATIVSLDYDLFWSRLYQPSEAARQTLPQHLPEAPQTALSLGIIRCRDCGLLLGPDDPARRRENPSCPRCGAVTHPRKPGSIGKTWALVLTSLILFIPANTLPIMRVDFLGIPEHSTILDGIIYFFRDGSIGIGLIILTASILVPLFKIVGLGINLITTMTARDRFLRQKTRMFRFIQFIGRWSMLDIFVIALLTVMVDFGFLTSIHTAPAATYFCLVVVCTMAAAIVFDPRVMWDRCAPATGSNSPNQQVSP